MTTEIRRWYYPDLKSFQESREQLTAEVEKSGINSSQKLHREEQALLRQQRSMSTSSFSDSPKRRTHAIAFSNSPYTLHGTYAKITATDFP